MKRIAESIVKYTSVDLSADIGLIIEEKVMIPRFRCAHRFSTFSTEYLHSQNEYDIIDRAFTFDFRAGAEFDDFDEKTIIIVRMIRRTEARPHDKNDQGIIQLKRICR